MASPDSAARTASDGALFDHVRVVQRYWRPIAAAAALAMIAGYAKEAAKPNEFTASTAVRFVVPDAVTSGTSAKDSALLLGASFERAAATPAFTERVRSGLAGGARTTMEKLRKRITVVQPEVPGFLDVTASGVTAKEAAALADATARELATSISTETERVATATLAPSYRQLAALDASLAAGNLADAERSGLLDQRGQLARQIADQEQRLRPTVLTPEPAALPKTPVGPNPGTTAVTFGLLVFVLATEAIVLWRFLRGRLPLGDPAGEIARLVDAPVVEVGPSGRRRAAGALLPFVLQHLGRESVITVVQRDGTPSALPGSMIADALSRSGRRVLLVDADTHAPQLHAELEMPLSPGLVEVVAGEETLNGAVRQSPTGSGVVVLSAGASSEPEARSTVASGGLELLVRHAGADVNVVVTSAATPLDEALLVVHQFPSAVVLAVDARSARKSQVAETARVIRSIGGTVAGALCVHTAAPGWRASVARLRGAA